MSWLDFFQRRNASAEAAQVRGKVEGAALGAKAANADSDELFDDSFQRRLEMLALSSRRLLSGRERADRSSKRQGQGIAFADHREYSAGDDFRFVDWGAYQRLGRLLVRVYEEQEDQAVYFLLDCSRSMAFGAGEKFAQARRICAALSYVSLTNLDRVSVTGLRSAVQSPPNAQVGGSASGSSAPRLPPVRGKHQIFKILRFLLRLEASGGTDLGRNLESFVAQNRRRGLAVLVSDLYDPKGYQRGIDLLRYNKFEPYVLHLCDATEYAGLPVGDVLLTDCETGESREITITEQLSKAAGAAFDEYCGEVRQYCRSKQVGYSAVDVRAPFDEVVLSLLKRGGLLGSRRKSSS